MKRFRIGTRTRVAAAAAVALALAVAAPALGAFPGSPGTPYPSNQESPRVNTPNDPGFDNCELDDEQGAPTCVTYWDEQFGLFGFSPDSAFMTAPGTDTLYANCDQLDEQGKVANQKAGDNECAQISGVRADSAWKFSAGSPAVRIAILDTGIRWNSSELRTKIALNRDELPKPAGSAEYDKNGDGAFNVDDYAGEVPANAGDQDSDGVLDGSDLIAVFSNDQDNDGNGYVDDIAGWDFFDDDNNPYDASSCCSAGGHGTGRANEAARATNNGDGEAGLCPRCQVVPLRVWDTFVVDTNLFSMGVVYAADNGIDVVEGAVGGLLNSQFARRAFSYADSKGVAETMVSSDINSANHNYPTHYNEAMYIAGSLPDSAPGMNCRFPGFAVIPDSPDAPGCPEFRAFLQQQGVNATTAPPTTSMFRNSNLTQYGGKADVVLVGSTGSENTGQASGAAGLLESYARERFAGSGFPAGLSNNETRQLFTMTAEDVLPENTGTVGAPDKANPGWDPHFGYGRLNLAGAMRKIQAGEIPPEVLIDAPDWFSPINVDKVGAGGVPIRGKIDSPHFNGPVTWELEFKCGQDGDTGWTQLASGEDIGVQGEIGRLTKAQLENLADTCDGSVVTDAGRPAGNPNQPTVPWPANPYPEPDPERHAFQIRLTAREKAKPSNVGRYRKTLHAYRDDGTLSGWPRPIGPNEDAGRHVTGGGGETSPRLYDMNGDNRLDVVLPNSSGEVHVLEADGDPLPSWNGGQPVKTEEYRVATAHNSLAGVGLTPREAPRTPTIGDIDGDGEPEVSLTAGEHLYAWHRDGSPVQGYPVAVDPNKSAPCKPGAPNPCFDKADQFITSDNHLKRGFLGSPALADLDEDGRLDVIAGALDQHVYAWDGEGDPLPGFPKRLDRDGAGDTTGAEIINSPTIADLDGDNDPEVVISTNEVVDSTDPSPDTFDPSNFLSLFASQAGGNNLTYAIHGNGEFVDGWPVEHGVLAGDVLPLVVPGNDAAAGDLDDGQDGDEVVLSAGTGFAKLVAGDGSVIRTFNHTPGGDSGVVDKSTMLNVAEYPAIGRFSDALGPSVVKGGATLGTAANLLAVNQNVAFNHAVQAWDPSTGQYRPGWPVATDDWQILSQPVMANVGGGAERQAIVGTGLYQLHAYGQTLGQEPEGWPKFTGGWSFATPSIGDMDGDGKLDATTVTREGWAFAWKTDVDACSSGGATTNNEWWTFHHDEHGTANYAHDARPPGTPRSLTTASAGGQLALNWLAPGDDWLCGKAAKYRIVGSDKPIDGPKDGTVLGEFDASAEAGKSESKVVGLPSGTTHVAVIYVDEAGNWGHAAGGQLGPGLQLVGSLGQGDRGRPSVVIDTPTYASDDSTSRGFPIRWRGFDPEGEVASYQVDVSTVVQGARGSRRTAFRRLRRTDRTRLRFRGRPGRTYYFRVRAIDRSGNTSSFATDRTVVPIDDHTRAARYSRSWRRARSRRAYGRRMHRSLRRGASLRMRFRGTRVALIGTNRRGVGFRVKVGRRSRVVRLRGRTRVRRVLFRSRGLRLGRRRHVMRVRVLRGRLDVDAFGVHTR